MNNKTDNDTTNGGDVVAIPLDELKTLKNQIAKLTEDVELLKAREVARRIDAGEEILIPSDVVGRVFVDNVHPLKAFREWRGLSQADLAKRAETSTSYISQIETGYRQPGRKLLLRLAYVL